MNRVELIGIIGKDPEIRQTASGTKVATFSVATTKSFKKGNEWENKTTWHKVVTYFKADYCEKYLKKGMAVVVHGEIDYRKWTAKDGKEMTTTEIIAEYIKGFESYSGNNKTQKNSDATWESYEEDNQKDLDDKIPFS